MAQKGNTASERLKKEGGREKEESLGIPVDGTVDPTGEFPKRYNWFGNSQSAAGRGVKINYLNVGGGALGMNFDVSYPSPSIYPFNYAMETPSGHSIEFDDTPGNERILLKHHTGGGIEIQPNGSVVIASNGKGVTVTNGDYNLAVTGSGEMNFEGDLNMRVNGNYNLEVNGTYNVVAGNNMNQQVFGTFITEVGDVHQTIVRGNKDIKVYGDTLDFHVGERKIVTKKDLRLLTNRDIIFNSHRHVRATAEGKFTAATADGISLVSEKINIAGRKGKIGGDNFHYTGTLFTGPSGDKGDPRNDQGQKTVFHGNLIGRALESWTSKYSLYSKEAHSAHISNFSKISSWADSSGYAYSAQCAEGADVALWANEAGHSVLSDWSTHASQAENASRALIAKTQTVAAIVPYNPLLEPQPSYDEEEFECEEADILYPNWIIPDIHDGSTVDIAGRNRPDYKFKWGWNVEDNTAYEQPLNVLENYEWDGKGNRVAIDPLPIAPFYTTNEDWFEVWNKVSPFAVRKVMIDQDGWIEKKLYKPSIYSHYFQTTPDTADIRSKLKTMDLANDSKTCPEMQCDNKKATQALLQENRLSDKYLMGSPPAPYKIKRKGKDFKEKYGYTLMGNPPERASKKFSSKNKAQFREILVDPKYNPRRQETPITGSTKLSKSTCMNTFLGAIGSKSTLEQVPIDEERTNLARYWVCQAQILEGVNSSPLFAGYRLAVTEGYYHPNSGIREHYKPGEDVEKKFWREPYRNEDGGIKHRTKSGHPTNQRRHEGMLVYYTLFDTRGKINYSKTWECALFIRDNFYFRELHLDYDITRPDDIMTVQIGIYMPVLYEEYKGMFEQNLMTYFNRTILKDGDLIEITDL